VGTGPGVGERQCRPVVILHPTKAALLWLRRVIIQVDRTAQVDPAINGPSILVAQRSDLDLVAIGPQVGAGHRLRRRHDTARVAHDRTLATVRRAGDRLPFQPQGIGIAWHRFDREVIVAETIRALAEDLPDQQAAPRLQRPDVARAAAIAIATGALQYMAVLPLVIHDQAEVRT